MTIAALPFIDISLVTHSAGGVILQYGGQYVAGTYIGAPVVEAFNTAASVLSSIATPAAAAASHPVVIGASIAVVAVGAYCYFYGIPAPIEAALAKAGLGGAAKGFALPGTKAGFAVPLPTLAVALILLGGAGYVVYRFYARRKAARTAMGTAEVNGGQAASEAAFGAAAWATFGQGLWSGLSDAAKQAAALAKDAAATARAAGGASGRFAYAGGNRAVAVLVDAGNRIYRRLSSSGRAAS